MSSKERLIRQLSSLTIGELLTNSDTSNISYPEIIYKQVKKIWGKWSVYKSKFERTRGINENPDSCLSSFIDFMGSVSIVPLGDILDHICPSKLAMVVKRKVTSEESKSQSKLKIALTDYFIVQYQKHYKYPLRPVHTPLH